MYTMYADIKKYFYNTEVSAVDAKNTTLLYKQ